jgi:Ca2+-transporting ATPase
MTPTRDGLSQLEAQQRLAQFGPNALPEARSKPLWARVLAQFRNPLIYILLFALALDLIFWFREGRHGFPLESAAIALILILNAVLGVYQERKAEAALARLKKLAAPRVWVRRDGHWTQVAAETLVVGDSIRLEAGDRVPADGRSTHSESASVDESILTGESLPVEKGLDDEFLSGTLLVRGRVHLEVTGIGSQSALGKLAQLLGDIQPEPTPLERRMDVFGRRVARWVLSLAAVIAAAGLLVDGLGHVDKILLFAVAMAVAAVPEGLPAVLTFTLALGVERMARRKAIVRKLSAVEALGSVTVIATDKTGTITENQMHVRQLDSPDKLRACKAIVLANDAEEGVGDPLDLALLRHAGDQGNNVDALIQAHPRVSSRAFDSAWKFMRVTVQGERGQETYLKGAPEVLLARSRLDPQAYRQWTEKAAAQASDGFRVLGIAWSPGSAEEGLEFLGLVSFWDPPRGEVPNAIGLAHDAGIRVLMVTGDHPETALAIARQIGIETDRVLTGAEFESLAPDALRSEMRRTNVFARVLPKHKLKLVELLQQDGEIVAMTGDGVNDAPALKRSDVGVAMGLRGSDVTREVADLVLLDDNFATIVAATEEGRSIYENIQKFIRFLFSTNFSELLVVAFGAVLAYFMGLRDAKGGLLLPLTAVQILWINLVTDGLPALALALDRNPSVMKRPPRSRSSPLLDVASTRFILLSGTIKGLIALGLLGLVPMLGFGLDAARSVCFQFLAVGQLLFVYPARHTVLRPLSNWTLHAVVALGVILQIAVGSFPSIMRALDLVHLPLRLWALILAAALLAWLLAEIVNRMFFRFPKPKDSR